MQHDFYFPVEAIWHNFNFFTYKLIVIAINFFSLEFFLHIIAFLKTSNRVYSMVYPIGCKYQSEDNNSYPLLRMLLCNLDDKTFIEAIFYV